MSQPSSARSQRATGTMVPAYPRRARQRFAESWCSQWFTVWNATMYGVFLACGACWRILHPASFDAALPPLFSGQVASALAVLLGTFALTLFILTSRGRSPRWSQVAALVIALTLALFSWWCAGAAHVITLYGVLAGVHGFFALTWLLLLITPPRRVPAPLIADVPERKAR